MRVVLFLCSLVAFLWGVQILAMAQTALHEIEGYILFVISAIFLSGAAAVDAIIGLKNKIDGLNNSGRDLPAAPALGLRAPLAAEAQATPDEVKKTILLVVIFVVVAVGVTWIFVV